ncbi:hypothetical protein HDU87_008136 [Geranomyces variabilis]|uniref:Uncharacterized protein n=1 Tax=Geranomyces variabilis TaxID=109894 RepID=A0AAD5TFT0_9FUNG|nr:hypothetical protein HDU87_008136 [Geranomyces variabilis]
MEKRRASMNQPAFNAVPTSEPSSNRDSTIGRDAAETTISELAAGAVDRTSKNKPKIPLLVLAPSLVIAALAAVLLPVCMVLLLTSQQSTTDLSNSYLSSIMSNTQLKVNHSIDGARFASATVGRLPATALAMMDQTNLLSEKPTWQLMGRLFQDQSLDGVQCYTASFKPNAGPEISFDTVSFTYLTVSRSFVPPYSNAALGISDYHDLGNARQFALNQSTLEIINGTNALGNDTNGIWPQIYALHWDMTFSNAIQELLQPVPRMNPFLGYTLNQQGLYGFAISQVFAAPTNPAFLYACGAVIVVDYNLNNLLVEIAKSSTSAVIALLRNNANMTLLTTSSVELTYAQVLAGNVSSDDLSQAIRAEVRARYPSIAAIKAQGSGQNFAATVMGASWIIQVDSVTFTEYSQDVLGLVVAIPRKAIFSKIDSAKSRSIGIAAGLSVGIALIMAVIFALIVTPLRHLAKAMGMLTQMDFAALDNGKILEEQSYISEIRGVQNSFSTMVKAFAGGIKKNRELQQTRGIKQTRVTTKKFSKHFRTRELLGKRFAINVNLFQRATSAFSSGAGVRLKVKIAMRWGESVHKGKYGDPGHARAPAEFDNAK